LTDTSNKPPQREFQVFAKPVGASCNLQCRYCYYLKNQDFYPSSDHFIMTDEVLEIYILQHIQAWTEPVISFSWHGGEPTLPGVDFYRKIVSLQNKHQPSGRRIVNSIQTNGTLLNEEWCRFLVAENFTVGISLDGPQDLHDCYRMTRQGQATFKQALRGYDLLRQHNIPSEILCVVNAHNVQDPLRVYRFFKQIGAKYISFLPLVEKQPITGSKISDQHVSSSPAGDCLVTDRSVPAQAFGAFLCTIFDEWLARDIGLVKIQIFEEAARTAFGQDHTLCIFRETCGGVPVIEHNGDFFSCDHFVDNGHLVGNICTTPLKELLSSPQQQAFGAAKLTTLPRYCLACEVRDMCNGGCPKNRFMAAPDGQSGLEYLCAGYKRFFNHCRPFVTQIAELWRRQNPESPHFSNRMDAARSARPGRNDSCPCGSGKKYKNCCLGK
jgi:uncharacterized protein